MKTCTQCYKEKELTYFYVSKTAPDGRRPRCIVCHADNATARKEKRAKEGWVKTKEKICSKCRICKRAGEYNSMKASPDGLRPDCKSCLGKSKKKHREENLEHCKRKNAEHYQKYSEHKRRQKTEYRNKNKEKVRLSMKRSYIKKKQKHIEVLRSITAPNKDGKWLYIMQHESLVKIGMSDNPHVRALSVTKRSGRTMTIRYIARPYKGRTIDTEGICHADLVAWQAPVVYKNGSVSHEWFRRTPEQAAEVLRKYCKVKEFHE